MGLFSGLFGKKKTRFKSPMTGKMLELSDVPDPVFASGTMGAGFAVELTDGIVAAPFDGKITACFPTGHAYGMESADGVEVLLHIGIDTVELKGAGFARKVENGQSVKQGDVLVEVDLARVKEGGKSVVSPVVFTAGQAVKPRKIGERIAVGENDILEYA